MIYRSKMMVYRSKKIICSSFTKHLPRFSGSKQFECSNNDGDGQDGNE